MMMKIYHGIFFPTMGVRIINILPFFLFVIDIHMPILIFTMHFVIAIVYFTCFTWFRLRSQCIDKRSPSKIILLTLTFSQFS